MMMIKPEYYELVYALCLMAWQYLSDDDGALDDMAMSAGEECIGTLKELNLIQDGRLVPESISIGWIKLYVENLSTGGA